jgi:DNA replication ATP-dependent helicase Dna2
MISSDDVFGDEPASGKHEALDVVLDFDDDDLDDDTLLELDASLSAQMEDEKTLVQAPDPLPPPKPMQESMHTDVGGMDVEFGDSDFDDDLLDDVEEVVGKAEAARVGNLAKTAGPVFGQQQRKPPSPAAKKEKVGAAGTGGVAVGDGSGATFGIDFDDDDFDDDLCDFDFDTAERATKESTYRPSSSTMHVRTIP